MVIACTRPPCPETIGWAPEVILDSTELPESPKGCSHQGTTLLGCPVRSPAGMAHASCACMTKALCSALVDGAWMHSAAMSWIQWLGFRSHPGLH